MLTVNPAFAGQSLRAALALSAATGKPFGIDNFRSAAEKPGILRRHLAAIRAAVSICGAALDGVEIGATAFSFQPKAVRPGDYRFAVGAAGSVVQVLQAAATGLQPKQPYVLALADNAAGTGTLQPLAAFVSNPAGAAVVNAVGPIRQLVQAEAGAVRRYLVIAPGTATQSGKPVQLQN